MFLGERKAIVFPTSVKWEILVANLSFTRLEYVLHPYCGKEKVSHKHQGHFSDILNDVGVFIPSFLRVTLNFIFSAP